MKISLEVERVLERNGAALPVEPLIHAEVRDVSQRLVGCVDHVCEKWVVPLRTDRHDHRDLIARLRGDLHLLEHLRSEVAIEVRARFEERERDRRCCGEL